MSYSVRTAQNKEKRETNEVKAKELNELRRENHKLKRENARLRSDLDKYLSWQPEDISPEENLAKEEPVKLVKTLECPTCKNKDLSKLVVGSKTLHVCKKCSWRSMAPTQEAA